jgi:ankyrin repeat protein
LHKAIEQSDYEKLSNLLSDGADPNEMCFGHTPLTHAVDLEGDGERQNSYPPSTAAAAILLAYGADPALPAADGETPLQIAEYYQLDANRTLLQRYLDRGGRR